MFCSFYLLFEYIARIGRFDEVESSTELSNSAYSQEPGREDIVTAGVLDIIKQRFFLFNVDYLIIRTLYRHVVLPH